ncbi:MAG: CCA tRNA nucleotidyltransferase, partial [Acidimicrobiia bacterium]
IDELEERIVDLSAREELASLRPPLDGNQIMSYLSIDPGPQVGLIMDILLEKRIYEGPYSAEEAYRIVREWAIDNGVPDPGVATSPETGS